MKERGIRESNVIHPYPPFKGRELKVKQKTR
jgi:hypothetical protein